MTDKMEKLRLIAQLAGNPPSDSDISVGLFAAKLQRIIDEPEIGDIRVIGNGHGSIVINGAVCAVVPMQKLKNIDPATHEQVLDALHLIQKDRDADKAFNDAY